MWFLVIGLVSIVASLMFGRLLARAAAEQTSIPNGAADRPAVVTYPGRRDALAELAARRRKQMMQPSLN